MPGQSFFGGFLNQEIYQMPDVPEDLIQNTIRTTTARFEIGVREIQFEEVKTFYGSLF